MTLDESGFIAIYQELGRVFLPHTPINQRAILRGRRNQITAILDTVFQPGRHVILYGERGVGKTSIAKVVHDIFRSDSPDEDIPSIFVPYALCDSSDDYDSIWRKIFRQIEIVEDRPVAGFRGAIHSDVVNLADSHDDEFRPDDVIRLLQYLSDNAAHVIVAIDEFDRVRNDEVTTLFADTIKALSDLSVEATLLLVGVANDVNELIEEHASAERATRQIPVPRMSATELQEILVEGLGTVGMDIDQVASTSIITLSQGLPHYTHLLGLNAARDAVAASRLHVTREDVMSGISTALSEVNETISSAYHRATMSSRKTIFPQVLLACALARLDEKGTFSSSDVRQPLSRIMGSPYEIPYFARNLFDLCQDQRGSILERIDVAKRYRYRFVNPLMQPFIIMHGLESQLIEEDHLVIQGRLDLGV